jgi:5-deoxy-glucuronate isomerase
VSEWYLPAGSTATDRYAAVITPESAGWRYSGLTVVELPASGRHEFSTGEAETLVLPLAGSAVVTCDGVRFELTGRADVFARVPDFVYLPRDAHVVISSSAGGRFAMPSARCQRRLPARYGPAGDVVVELRGAGACSRQVNNFCTPETFEADKLIACEVLTPGGNWSSYPPHKHDEHTDTERELEEIYYFEVAEGPGGPGIGYQRVYGSAQRPVEVLAEVRSGDAVVIGHGWHGPSMAAPGYDLYYLNVMAGPSADRAWLISDDPAHGWIRQTWADQRVDARLPLSSATAKGE